MTKTIFTIILFFCSISLAFTQDRISKVKIKPLYKFASYSDTIPSARFWTYDSKEDKWESSIGSKYNPFRESQNFTNLNLVKVIGDNKTVKYVLFYRSIKTGKLNHSSHMSNIVHTGNTNPYYSNNIRDHFTITQEDYLELKKLILKSDSKSLKISSKFTDSYGNSNLPIERYSNANYQVENENYKEKNMWFRSTTNHDKKVVRFRIPQHDRCSNGTFKQNYFEVPYEEFIRLFID